MRYCELNHDVDAPSLLKYFPWKIGVYPDYRYFRSLSWDDGVFNPLADKSGVRACGTPETEGQAKYLRDASGCTDHMDSRNFIG